MSPVIRGMGLDMVEIARFRAALRRHGRRFLEKVFTPAEQRYCAGRPKSVSHYAARFAAKEAVLKALGTGWSGGIRWTDVEVVRARTGAVTVRLTGEAKRAAARKRIRTVHLSMTHTESAAAATAVAEGR